MAVTSVGTSTLWAGKWAETNSRRCVQAQGNLLILLQSFLSFFFFFYNVSFFNWGIIDIQYILVPGVRHSVWHLCTLQIDHCRKSSNHLSLYKVIMVLLTVFPVLYITSLWLIYFITGSLYFLIHFKYFTQPPAHPSSNHQMVLCIWVCFCLVFFVLALDFTYKWTHIFVFLCQWQNSIFLWVVQIYIYIRVLM